MKRTVVAILKEGADVSPRAFFLLFRARFGDNSPDRTSSAGPISSATARKMPKRPKNVAEIERNSVGAVITVNFYRFFEKLGKITANRGFSKRNFKRKYRQNSEAGKFAYLR